MILRAAVVIFLCTVVAGCVTLQDSEPGSSRIAWSGVQYGKPVCLDTEPGGGLLRGLGAWFYSILPGIESLL